MPKGELIYRYLPDDCVGMRLDQALASLFPDYSRARLQKWIKAGHLRVNGRVRRPGDTVLGGELVHGELPLPEEVVACAQNLPLDVCYEDEDILVINKPAGLVVHPAAGNPDGTLVNALLYHAPELTALPRAGLVHRLDKDTSGLLVVARSPRAHLNLVGQLQARTLEREYEAVVMGVLSAGGKVAAPVGRHPVDRQRMAVTANGKPAVTYYWVIKRFHAYTHLRVKLETGRTHQIRVHMAHIRHPLLGDPVYGKPPRLPSKVTTRCIEVLRNLRRQALHATRLSLTHPSRGERLEWRVKLPADMVELLQVLSEEEAKPSSAAMMQI
jgi:23S rRNA pseudouridine1911/1915/1917 synthase